MNDKELTIDKEIQEANAKLNELISKWQSKVDGSQAKKDYKIAVNFAEAKLDNLKLKKRVVELEIQVSRITNDIKKIASVL